MEELLRAMRQMCGFAPTDSLAYREAIERQFAASLERYVNQRIEAELDRRGIIDLGGVD